MEDLKLENHLKKFINKKFNEIRSNVVDKYSQRLVEATLRYQKKYGFELNSNNGREHLTWNCEADAFKHTFGSALIAMEQGNIRSWGIGYAHEHEYLINENNHSNPTGEKNMDTNNNRVGRSIANELVRDYTGRWDNLSQQEKEDIIADRVWNHM